MKLTRSSYWLKSGAYTFLEKFSLQLFRFGSFYLLVRGLTKEHFGIWTLFLIISALVEVTRIGLVQNALVKYLTATPNERVRGRINTASLILNMLITSISVLMLFALAGTQEYFWDLLLLEELLYLYIFTTIALIPFFQFNFIQQANFDFRGIFWSNFARQGFFFVYVLYCYFNPEYPFKLLHLAAAQIVAALFGSVVAYWLARPYLRFSARLDLNWVRWLFSYGKFVVGTNLGSMFNKSIDQLMLGVMINPVAVAMYGTAVKVTNLVEVPTQSIAAIVFPKSAQQAEAEGTRSVRHLYEKSVGVILALIIPGIVFVVLFPDFVLRFIAGERYLDTRPVLQVTMLYGLFVPFARQFGTMMDAIGKPKLNFYLVLISALLNAVFNYLLIGQFGVIGAAYATLTTFIILFVANQVVLHRELGVRPHFAFLYALKVYRNGFQLMWTKVRGRKATPAPPKAEPVEPPSE